MAETFEAGTVTAPGTSLFLRLMSRLEGLKALDTVVRWMDPLARPLVAGDRRRRFFHGEATGIPPHIIATDVPFGAWFMALFLDHSGDAGSRGAARRLIGLGVLAAAPTAVTGWAEWARAETETRRIGVVHAAANGLATSIFLASWVARRQGRHEVGVRLGRLGGVVLVTGGFLGGHMGRGRRPTAAG